MAWTEQLPSGNWRGLYRDGNRKTRSAGTYPHERKALLMAEAKEEESRLPGWRDPRAAGRKWGDWYPVWWAAHDVAPSTKRSDASLVKNHILPHWKDVALVDITRFAVREWVARLTRPKGEEGAGLAESSVARTVRVFSTSLSAAVDAEVLTDNPCFRLGLEPGETDLMRFFTHEEVSRMLKKLKNRPRDRAVLSLLVGTGLRYSEMLGLAPERVDLKRRMLRVTEVMDQHTHEVKKYPKGRKIRDVPIPAWVIQEIKPFVKTGGPRVFDTMWNWRRDAWEPLNTGGRPHDLRHTYASWLLQGGVEIAKVSKLMGHSSIRVTERYAHIALVPSQEVDDVLRDPRV